MPYSEKECVSCHQMYSPTSGRQLVCTDLECQLWWAAQPRKTDEPPEKAAQRIAVVKHKAKTPPDKEEVRLNAIRWRRENPEKAKEADKASKAKRRANDLEGARRAERNKRRRQRAANPEKAKADARESARRLRERDPGYHKRWFENWRVENPEKFQAFVEKRRVDTKKWRLANPEKAKALWLKREASKKNASIVDIVERLVVAERDKWICYLCERPIDPLLSYCTPDGKWEPGYLNVDHVLPLARGGEHSYANVKASHAICNSYKNDRLLEELDESVFAELSLSWT